MCSVLSYGHLYRLPCYSKVPVCFLLLLSTLICSLPFAVSSIGLFCFSVRSAPHEMSSCFFYGLLAYV